MRYCILLTVYQLHGEKINLLESARQKRNQYDDIHVMGKNRFQSEIVTLHCTGNTVDNIEPYKLN